MNHLSSTSSPVPAAVPGSRSRQSVARLGSPRGTPGAGAADALRRYLAFYLATSLLWDTVAAAGNALLLAGLGRPTLRALARFRDRLQFEVRPA